MRLSDLFEWIYIVDLNPQLSRFQETEHLVSVIIKFQLGYKVVEQTGANDLDVFSSEQPRDDSLRFSVFQTIIFRSLLCSGLLPPEEIEANLLEVQRRHRSARIPKKHD